MRILVAGWFSWEDMGTTAGDLIARDIVCDWLRESGLEFEIAVHQRFPYPDAVDWTQAASDRYTDIIFVCGPFGNGYPVTNMLNHFSSARLIGVDLSLLDSLENWNPFVLLYERDSSRASNPDITFLAPPPKIPVIGLILAHKQKEYGVKSKHESVNKMIENLLDSRQLAIVPIDTAILENQGGLRTEGEIESLISKMDVVITTRLHGTVLALKNGIPVIPVDPIAGGAKISLQVRTLNWPILFNPDNIMDKSLEDALDYCLTFSAKQKAEQCALEAILKLNKIKEKFLKEIKELEN